MSDSTDPLAEILSKDKEFENLAIKYDPGYEAQNIGFALVKKFIEDNKLILYGGMAIDGALRLRGDKIYPDDNIPDYDFYSPENVEHSYALADILYHKGLDEARSINALHMETMRVYSDDAHQVADITYRPKKVFDTLPYLIHDKLRIIHPNFQRIDMHSSLSFPYDGPPQEVIFARWEKDIKRFNKLDHHYPITIQGDVMPLRSVTVPYANYVLSGFAAYAVIYNEFMKGREDVSATAHILPTKFDITVINDTKSFVFDTLEQTCDLLHVDISKAADEYCKKLMGGEPEDPIDPTVRTKYQPHIATRYEPYANMIPSRIEINYMEKKINILSTKHRVLSINSVEISNMAENTPKIRVANIQFVLKQFISMHYVTLDKPKISNTYLAYYKSLLDMTKIGDRDIVFPSVTTYGGDNVSLSREVALNKLYVELEGIDALKIPKNYYPGRSIPNKRPHPEFDPEEVEFFREQGRIIV